MFFIYVMVAAMSCVCPPLGLLLLFLVDKYLE